MQASSRWSIRRWQIALTALLLLSWSAGAVAQTDKETTIRLLSNDAADACIQDVDCMGRLFMQAAFGEDENPGTPAQPLLKWAGPVQIASFFGAQIDEDLQLSIRASLAQMHLLGSIAGADLSLAKRNSGEVINFVMLISQDFAKDRDSAFSTLLSGVFAGRSALYDELSSGPSPVCRGHLFAETGGASISGGLALIEDAGDATAFRRCLHQTALNVLGLQHHLPADADSVLNPISTREAWTSIDFLLLRMLSDPALMPAMAKQDVAALLPAIHQRALRPSS
jgi:hypothetical protein